MRLVPCKIALTGALLFLWLATTSSAQEPQPPNAQAPAPAVAASPSVSTAAAAPKPEDYLPRCSTEKVNGNCFLNIDRRYPISMPPFQMRSGAHITVYVFYPLPFESLTLDPGAAQAFESTDQAAGLVSAFTPLGKGAIMAVVNLAAGGTNKNLADLSIKLEGTHLPADDFKLAQKIQSELGELNKLLDQALDPLPKYVAKTKVIYAQVREIESAVPRPAQGLDNSTLRSPGVDAPPTPNPWEHYQSWRQFMIKELKCQGDLTTKLLDRLPGLCQKEKDPKPAVGPWLASARKCENETVSTQIAPTPLAIPNEYDEIHKKLEENLAKFSQDRPDPSIYKSIRELKDQLEKRHQQVSEVIALAPGLLPAQITKITTDMESVFANILMTPDTIKDPVMVGVISGPDSLNRTPNEKKILAPYKALGPQITYTVNAQNEIANSILSLPSAAQKQAVVTITALYAAPRFEVSAGAFLSWLPNRTFSNRTDVTITGGVPAPADLKIDMTKTVPPLVIPFAAANYRISPEYDWLGGRRNAFYATLGIGLNPYNSQVEYVGGFSFSWRYLMFSPLYHFGRGTHLTQDEQVGQIWCNWGASEGSNPPSCSGSFPSPSTKNYWTGAFALGISVRIPTTFSSSNH